MAKCYSCGKNFDYEKYYGICPKCGTYNKENISEELHREMHEKYDEGMVPPQSHYEEPAMLNTETSKKGSRDSVSGTLIFIFLIIGIVASMASPFIFAYTEVVCNESEIIGEDKKEETQESEEDKYGGHKPQKAEVVETTPGQVCSMGKDGNIQITAIDAKVLTMANHVSDFPENENLIEISVSYAKKDEYMYGGRAEEYFCLGTYVGYGENIYKNILPRYSMNDYPNVIGDITLWDIWDVLYNEGGEGKMLVFVPEDITTINLYLESRDEETNDVLTIYKIPLEIKPGEEI